MVCKVCIELRLCKRSGSTQAIQKLGGSGGFGLFLGRNDQKLPKKGQKKLKSAIFDHSYFGRFWPTVPGSQ